LSPRMNHFCSGTVFTMWIKCHKSPAFIKKTFAVMVKIEKQDAKSPLDLTAF